MKELLCNKNKTIKEAMEIIDSNMKGIVLMTIRNNTPNAKEEIVYYDIINNKEVMQ